MRRLLHQLYMTLVLLIPTQAFSAWELNMPRGVTETSHTIYDLHMLILWICVAIGVVVFGVMFWSIIYHRKSRGAKAAQFHESTTVEVIWTIIPFIILIGMAVPATNVLIDLYDTSESDIDIQVTGYQWKWHYNYLNEEVDFFSTLKTAKEEVYNEIEKNPNYLLDVDNEVVVPINKKVRFLFTSNDVIHSWWMPDLAVKKDAIPGFINESWTRINEVGTYRGQCAELCGKDHAFMPIVVKAVTQEDYDVWVSERKALALAKAAEAEQTWSKEDLIAKGEVVYQKSCAGCHMANGAGIPPAFPALNGNDIVNGDIDKHIDVIVNGVPGTAMAAYANQLSAVELAAVITYKRNTWDNNTGDVITPADINAFMNK